MRLGPKPEVEEEPGQFWKDFIRETAPVFRTPTIDQLRTFIAPTFAALLDGARHVDERLAAIIAEVQPDVIVEDNVLTFPAILASGRPWVRVVSCNPAEVKDPNIAPAFSGYAADDRGEWDAYRAEYAAAHADLHASFSAFCVERGAPPLPDGEFVHDSDWLNLYLYPDMVDYARERPLDATWHNLQTSVRATDEAWEVPAELRNGPGKLVYLSLGSLGSGDVELFQGLIDTMAGSGHRIIVSKGPQHEQIKLYDNMAGAEFLPQTSVLPHVDLVITHGGNNTVTEALYFGKPMVLLPLFWDQYDNAQRIHETGLGRRLDTYGHAPEELRAAVDALLGDEALAARLAEGARALQAQPGTVRAADLIERLPAG
jgi:MGT family glycosyltransferase